MRHERPGHRLPVRRISVSVRSVDPLRGGRGGRDMELPRRRFGSIRLPFSRTSARRPPRRQGRSCDRTPVGNGWLGQSCRSNRKPRSGLRPVKGTVRRLAFWIEHRSHPVVGEERLRALIERELLGLAQVVAGVGLSTPTVSRRLAGTGSQPGG